MRSATLDLIRKLEERAPVELGCTEYTAVVVRGLREKAGVESVHVIGSFESREGILSAIHHWVELSTGEWLDPTSAQFGLPECLILPPHDRRRRFYKGAVLGEVKAVEVLTRDLKAAQDAGDSVRLLQPLRVVEDEQIRRAL